MVDLEKEIQAINKKKVSILTAKSIYEDLTHLKTFTIDDKGTKEIDDAISVDLSSNTIWVHISSPCEFINPNCNIDNYAKHHMTTKYFVKDTIYMLPIELITQSLSLEVGKRHLTLSIGFVISDNGEISDYRISRTIIKPSYQLTYDEADELIDLQPKEEKEFNTIYTNLNKHYLNRKRLGSINIEEIEGQLTLDNGEIKILPRMKTLSRLMISEAMIIYGALFAQYCHKNNIPIPYRNQYISIETQDILKRNYKSEHCKNFLIKSSLNKSVLELSPKGHYSLAVNEYTHATSPLRRYIDIISHSQMLCFLTNRMYLSDEIIVELIGKYNTVISEVNAIIRSDRRAYLLKWFRLNISQKWNIIFLRWLRKSDHIALLYFEDISFDVITIFKPLNKVYLGCSFKVKIRHLKESDDIIEVTIL